MLRKCRKSGGDFFLSVMVLVSVAGYSTQVRAASRSANNHMLMNPPLVQQSPSVVLKHRRTVRVNIRSLAFTPAHLVVSPGTKIVWVNQDSFQHTSTSDHGLWDSRPIKATGNFLHVFKRVGTFTYHCTIHPFMHGTISVAK